MSNKDPKLFRSKSLSSLSFVSSKNEAKENSTIRSYRSRTSSNSSVEVVVVNESDSESKSGKSSKLVDSGLEDTSHEEQTLTALEQKIDKLSDMFLEQCRLLTALKEEIRYSKTVMEKVDFTQASPLTQAVKKVVDQSDTNEVSSTSDEGGNPRAKVLLDAIESPADKDHQIKHMIAHFLQSEDVQRAMVDATARSVRGVVAGCVTRDVSLLYLPLMEHAQRRLFANLTVTIEEAFRELEDSSASLSKSVFKISKSLRRAIERHQLVLEAAADPANNLLNTLKCAVEELLQTELHQWREKVLDLFTSQLLGDSEGSPASPPDPPQTPSSSGAAQGLSIIDQLMTAAELTKQVEDGDVEGAFSRALCACDMPLVRAVCRAASRCPPAPQLAQNTLLALLQQLSTDMLHDTQLKCRYLEDAMINLDLSDPSTRIHLPLVIGEVRKNLSNFLVSFPSHAAARRIALILMAADNLLK